jgi:hypothetical protein
MAVAYDEVEEAVFEKLILNAAEHARGVTLADFRNNDTDRVGALLAQAAGHGVGGVAVKRRGMQNTFLRLFGDAMHGRRTVDNA